MYVLYPAAISPSRGGCPSPSLLSKSSSKKKKPKSNQAQSTASSSKEVVLIQRIPKAAHSAALSTSTSSKTTFGSSFSESQATVQRDLLNKRGLLSKDSLQQSNISDSAAPDPSPPPTAARLPRQPSPPTVFFRSVRDHLHRFSGSRRWLDSFSRGSGPKLAIDVAGTLASVAVTTSLAPEVYATEPPSAALVPKEVVLYQY
ncbi:hypothetical protein EV1_003241 [Malus domestica]